MFGKNSLMAQEKSVIIRSDNTHEVAALGFMLLGFAAMAIALFF